MRFYTFIFLSISTLILSHAAPLDEGIDKRTGYGGSHPVPGSIGPLKRESDIWEARDSREDIGARDTHSVSVKGREPHHKNPSTPRAEPVDLSQYLQGRDDPSLDAVSSGGSRRRDSGEVEEREHEDKSGSEKERRDPLQAPKNPDGGTHDRQSFGPNY